MKPTLLALLVTAALLLLHGLLDRADRIAYARWVRESCLPGLATGDKKG